MFISKVMQRELPGINSYFLMLHFKKHVYMDNNTHLLAVNANQKKKNYFFGWLVLFKVKSKPTKYWSFSSLSFFN